VMVVFDDADCPLLVHAAAVNTTVTTASPR
jgi:hypothetical protein